MDDVLAETRRLISADKVSGTTVYNKAGDAIGEVYDVMIDKATGKVAYAVLSFGGFLGMGEKYHPLPWSLLKYQPAQGGYVVDLSKKQLEGAPAYDAGADPDWENRNYEEKIYGYYGAPPYWIGIMP
jgi:sporulation protein YlmC with PRC-barrel domain